MPGLPVYQDSASQLKSQIFGYNLDEDEVKNLLTDNDGKLIITTDATTPIDVEAVDLDIRDLINATDSVAVYGNDGTDNQILLTDATGRLIITTDGTTPIDVEAVDLDIRDLTNATDSVAVYGNDGTDNQILLTDDTGKLETLNNHNFTDVNFGTLTTADAYAYVAGQDISNSISYSFYVKNTDLVYSVNLQVQLSPDDINWVDDGAVTALLANTATILSANKFLKFIRLGYKSTLPLTPADINIIFQSQS